MLEHLWLTLAVIGLCSPRSWWVSLLLTAMGSVQIAAFYALPSWGYSLAAPVVEFLVAVAVGKLAHRDNWSTAIVWLFLASFTVQAVGAFFGAFGLPVDRLLYVGLNTIFTAQLACVAYSGGRCLARSVSGLGSSRRNGGDGAAEYSTQRGW